MFTSSRLNVYVDKNMICSTNAILYLKPMYEYFKSVCSRRILNIVCVRRVCAARNRNDEQSASPHVVVYRIGLIKFEVFSFLWRTMKTHVNKPYVRNGGKKIHARFSKKNVNKTRFRYCDLSIYRLIKPGGGIRIIFPVHSRMSFVNEPVVLYTTFLILK